MGLFSKDEGVPEIPTAPTLPELPKTQSEEKKGLPELPSFPTDSKNENLNQEMVKSAVSDNTPEEKKGVMDIQKDMHISEEPRGGQKIPPVPSGNIPPSQPSIADLPSKTTGINSIKKGSLKENEPIFVRIDKFQSAQKHFEQIKDKVKEIESIIGKIKDVKSKEEVELKGWAEDVERIKSKLSEIDSDIFDQI
jgi:hypothetical protein